MTQVGAKGSQVSDTKFKAWASWKPGTHLRKIKTMQQLGATAIVIMNARAAIRSE